MFINFFPLNEDFTMSASHNRAGEAASNLTPEVTMKQKGCLISPLNYVDLESEYESEPESEPGFLFDQVE